MSEPQSDPYEELYRKLVAHASKIVNERVLVDELQEELGVDEALLQAAIGELDERGLILGHKSNHDGPLAYDLFVVKPAMLKEVSRLKSASTGLGGAINIQIVAGNNNNTIQGDRNTGEAKS